MNTILQLHDDVIKWKHFPRYCPFVRGIHRSPVNSKHKGQWRGALMFSLICALNKRFGKQSRGWWFETSLRSLWRHCNGMLWFVWGWWVAIIMRMGWIATIDQPINLSSSSQNFNKYWLFYILMICSWTGIYSLAYIGLADSIGMAVKSSRRRCYF